MYGNAISSAARTLSINLWKCEEASLIPNGMRDQAYVFPRKLKAVNFLDDLASGNAQNALLRSNLEMYGAFNDEISLRSFGISGNG